MRLKSNFRGRLGGEYATVCVDRTTKKVHVLVLEAFCGLRPKLQVAAHNNGNSRDNRLVNLRWATIKENAQDAKKHGRLMLGERHYKACLNNEICKDVLRLSQLGLSQKEIAKKYSVCRATISHVLTGRTWKHIERAKFNLPPIGA
jgi:predicted XRE-type DNA-binding protein